METLRLYIDSSVWNAAFDGHTPETQAQTRDFLRRVREPGGGHVFVSTVVLQELARAPAERTGLLRELLHEAAPDVLELDDESAALAEAYVAHGVLTAGHIPDAQHVAIATVAQLNVIVSWNYRHLVNRRRREAFNGVNAITGYHGIDIISPPEVFDE